MFHQDTVLYLPAMLGLLHPASWTVSKTHSGTLAAEAGVGEASSIEATGTKGVAVGSTKRVDLGISTKVLVASHEPALRLAMRWKAQLMERRVDAWPGAEAPDLWWHRIERRGQDSVAKV